MKSAIRHPQSKMLLSDLRQLIAEARQDVARQVNSTLVLLYWRVGHRIRRDILKEKRAEYGERILYAVSAQLTDEFGPGWSEKNLRHMIRFAEAFPQIKIVSALMRQLAWTHFTKLIYLDDPLKRDFYAEMCRIEKWSTRTLEKKIGGLLFERTALSKKPDELICHELDQLRDEDKLTPDLVFRDPYFLDFLGLKDRYLEKDIEDAIMRELENFILELGVGFAFVARQKRIQVDNDDHYLDLLFYHRALRRLVAILGMGTAGIDVRTMAKQVAGLIREHKEKLTLDHLRDVPGMGLAKAAQILSAFELARRHLLKETVKIACAQDVLPLVADIAAKPQEHFVCISLNGANEVIEKRVVTIGLLDQGPVHPREVFADVIADRAAAVIFAHNHPNGDSHPSEADVRLQDRLTEAAKILGLRVLDHIIVSKKGHYSFQESGLIG